MAPELRKRKAVESQPGPPIKKASKASQAVAKVKNAVKKTVNPAKSEKTGLSDAPEDTNVADVAPATASKSESATKHTVGETVDLRTFGGEIETNEGVKTTLGELVEQSKSGVVLFTYPKASTPGCTKQACLFRDEYTKLTAGGLSIYGLSTDSPKSNTTFKERQKLPYPLLCDPNVSLISAIGLKKPPKGTTRGLFVVDKNGTILAAGPGSPQGTVEVVQNVVREMAAKL